MVDSTLGLCLIRPPERPLRLEIDPEALGRLADSMAAEGLHQPIGVRGPLEDGTYEIIYGHRRYLAAQMLRWPEIACRVYPPDYPADLARLSENLQRADLSPIEEARAVAALVQAGQPLAAIARLCRRSDAWVRERLQLLELPPDLQRAVHQRELPLAVAAQLARVDHEEYRQELIREARDHGATARTVAVWVAHYEADRDRILSNRMTVQEIVDARAAYRIYYPCDACGREGPYEDTRSWRLCWDCHSALRDALALEDLRARMDGSGGEAQAGPVGPAAAPEAAGRPDRHLPR